MLSSFHLEDNFSVGGKSTYVHAIEILDALKIVVWALNESLAWRIESLTNHCEFCGGRNDRETFEGLSVVFFMCKNFDLLSNMINLKQQNRKLWMEKACTEKWLHFIIIINVPLLRVEYYSVCVYVCKFMYIYKSNWVM